MRRTLLSWVDEALQTISHAELVTSAFAAMSWIPFRNCFLLSSETPVRAFSHLSMPDSIRACISLRLSALRNSIFSCYAFVVRLYYRYLVSPSPDYALKYVV